MESLYEILQVSKDADKSEIKKAYFKLIRSHPPEKDPERFKLIRRAYELLMDDEQRDNYDKIIDVPEKYAKDFIKARDHIDNSDYKAAITILEKLNKKFADEPKIKKNLGEAYEKAGNTTKAIKIFEALAKKNPNDHEASLGLIQSYKSRGFIHKAESEYERFLDENPANKEVWLDYIHFCKLNSKVSLLELFQRAESADKNIFSDDYPIYAYAVFNALSNKRVDIAIRYFEKFAENYIFDDKVDIVKFEIALSMSLSLSAGDYFEKIIGKLVPYLEKFESKTDDHIREIEEIKENLSQAAFFDDNLIKDMLKDLTEILIKDCNCEDCMLDKFMCEFYIVMNIDLCRKSLLYMKNNYPDMYKLHYNFYNEVLFKNRGSYLLEKYTKKHATLEKKYPDFFSVYYGDDENYDDDEYDDDEYEDYDDDEKYTGPYKSFEGRVVPFTRPEPKIGRNEPCPCGSGKKYKNCCGKS